MVNNISSLYNLLKPYLESKFGSNYDNYYPFFYEILKDGLLNNIFYSYDSLIEEFNKRYDNINQIYETISATIVVYLHDEILLLAKQAGFTDKLIAKPLKCRELAVARRRREVGMYPRLQKISHEISSKGYIITYNFAYEDLIIKFDDVCNNLLITNNTDKFLLDNMNIDDIILLSTNFNKVSYEDRCRRIYFEGYNLEHIIEIIKLENITHLYIDNNDGELHDTIYSLEKLNERLEIIKI